ncbi:hypothetical protein NQ318_003834, partial [Aromia moschata]
REQSDEAGNGRLSAVKGSVRSSLIFYSVACGLLLMQVTAPEVIKWSNDAEKQEIEQYFRHKNRFPGIIGLIDGTHIKIDKPRDDPDSYINRKGFYSDSDMLDRPQINYNMQHSSNRIKIEHCNEVLKKKWRQLYHTKLKEIRVIVNFIRACSSQFRVARWCHIRFGTK